MVDETPRGGLCANTYDRTDDVGSRRSTFGLIVGLAAMALVATTSPAAYAGPATCLEDTATITGTPGDDILLGSPGKDVIAGLGGIDQINGGLGDDVICGDDGNDRVRGSFGADRLSGGTGIDLVGGGDGNDELLGDFDADELSGGEGHQLIGDQGNDTLEGRDGNDLLKGGSDDDVLSAESTPVTSWAVKVSTGSGEGTATNACSEAPTETSSWAAQARRSLGQRR